MRTEQAIAQRSSTRGFTAEPLTAAEQEALLRAGLQAPTAANRQEIHFTALPGDHPALRQLSDALNRARGLTDPPHNFYYEAPFVVFLSADRSYHWSPLDAGIAVENMALLAEEMGLGSLIIGCVYDLLRGEGRAAFEQALAFPAGYEYEIAVAFGHKAVEKAPHTFDAAAQVTRL